MDRPVGVGSWAVWDDGPFPDAWTPAVPFKAKAACRRHIPKQRHRVTNWAEYDAALRARGSLTIWFTREAIAAWRAEPRTTRGGQPCYSDLAIATTLTLRAVFRLALRQTEGLIGSILQLLGLDLPVPDHSTLSRRAETLEVPRPQAGRAPVHLLVDSTGLKLCGPGERLEENHGTKRAGGRRVLHLGPEADTGRIVGSALTDKDADGGSQVGPLLDQIEGAVASLTGNGAYARDDVYAEVAVRHPAAAVVVPPRHLVAWIRQESSRIRHLWRLTDSEVSSLFSGLAYPCNKVSYGRRMIWPERGEPKAQRVGL